VPFIPTTDADREEMLKTIGVKTIDELFTDIPKDVRYPRLGIGKGLSELEVLRELESMAAKNTTANSCAWFLGAGAYNHFIPSLVPQLASRGEFLTAYTPYQPEVSQGTLQAIFEYQSMAANLFGVDAVNASHYDGATALAEAVLMAYRMDENRHEILLPAKLHPEYKEVIRTYFSAFPVTIKEYTEAPLAACSHLTEHTACMVIAYPDFEGYVADLTGVADKVHEAGALCIVSTDPIMLGLFKAPGELGADIVTAEGQALGNAMNYGGPFLGMFGVKQPLIRKMPGRLVGETKDKAGRRGFVLTLSAREQHIRREKAVSNICSNQGLVMLQAAIYLETMGKNGLQAVAKLCWDKAHYAADVLSRVPGYAVQTGVFFKEFVLKTPVPAEAIADKLTRRCIVPGLPLSRYYKDRTHELLVCVTEMNTKQQIDMLAEALGEAAR